MSLVTLCFNTSMCISMCQAIADNHGYVGIDQETVLINRKKYRVYESSNLFASTPLSKYVPANSRIIMDMLELIKFKFISIYKR